MKFILIALLALMHAFVFVQSACSGNSCNNACVANGYKFGLCIGSDCYCFKYGGKLSQIVAQNKANEYNLMDADGDDDTVSDGQNFFNALRSKRNSYSCEDVKCHEKCRKSGKKGHCSSGKGCLCY